MNQPIENRLTFNGPTCYSRLTNITMYYKIDQHSSTVDFCTSLETVYIGPLMYKAMQQPL